MKTSAQAIMKLWKPMQNHIKEKAGEENRYRHWSTLFAYYVINIS